MAGAPEGNQNAAKGKRWKSVIAKRLEELEAMEKVADALITKAMEGDIQAIKEIGDRIDGKATQPIAGDREHDPIEADLVHTVEFIVPNGQPKG